MSMVELRRNSLPHLGVLPLVASPPVWRKTSHPPLAVQKPELPQLILVTPPRTPRSKRFSNREMEESSPRSVSPAVYNRMITLAEDKKSLIRGIINESKNLIKAETCSLFLLDKANQELVATIFDRADKVNEIRIPMDQGVVGRVAMTKTMMNVRDVNRCPFFYAHVDEITGFQTRSILCFPIIDNAGVFVGVVELCNKEGKSGGFSKFDEQKARTFALYCANSLSHCLLLQKVHEVQRRTHMAGEWIVKDPIAVNPREVEHLAREPIRPCHQIHPQFSSFSFSPRSIGGGLEYVRAAMSMFQDLGFTYLYGMRQDTLARFVLRVANGYRDVAYHNWSHAFAVAHFAWNALKTPKVRSALDELERLSLLIACLCHDIDHRGTNNKFQCDRRTPLAILYSNEGSVLEQHHYAQTVMILGSKECNILSALTRTQYQSVLAHIRDDILATDIAVHLQKLPRFREMVTEGYNDLSVDHHYLLSCLLMTASDLSDQSKDFTNSKAIAENIYQEFFCQGDMEKAHGTEPMNMMDRDRANVAQIQIDFMDNVAVPVFELLAAVVPDGRSVYESILNNRECWKKLSELLEDYLNRRPALGLEYLRDEQLEKRVVEGVRTDREQRRQESQENGLMR